MDNEDTWTARNQAWYDMIEANLEDSFYDNQMSLKDITLAMKEARKVFSGKYIVK